MPAEHMMQIHLVHGSEAELQTEQQLLHLLDRYDLRPLLVTHDVVIDGTTVPHSHPRLTLHTRHLEDDRLLLAAFLHEQLHWFLSGRLEAARGAEDELRQRFPDLSLEPPDGDSDSTYLHIIVNELEFDALTRLLGDHDARAVIERHANEHYRAIYRLVLDHHDEIAAIIGRHGLRPPGPPAPTSDL
jgi:hypothetical protein